MAHMEITRELAREFLERMVDEGLFVKVRGLLLLVLASNPPRFQQHVFECTRVFLPDLCAPTGSHLTRRTHIFRRLIVAPVWRSTKQFLFEQKVIDFFHLTEMRRDGTSGKVKQNSWS